MQFASQQLERCTRFHFSRRMRMMSMLKRKHRIIYTLYEVFFFFFAINMYTNSCAEGGRNQSTHTHRSEKLSVPFAVDVLLLLRAKRLRECEIVLWYLHAQLSLARLNFPCVSHSNAAASGCFACRAAHRWHSHTPHTLAHLIENWIYIILHGK